MASSTIVLRDADLTVPPISLDTDPEQRIDAWRQAHFASQAVSEVGKLWADKQADDSHSALSWDAGSGAMRRGGSGIEGGLLLGRLRLELGAPGGTPEEFGLSGKSLDAALEFVRERGRAIAGEPKQESVPAPDLPDHAVGRGAAFDESGGRAFEEIAALYGACAALLEGVRGAAGAEASEVQVWPHHFDMAVLVVINRDESGAMRKTIGVGLTPPDSVEPSGYFYVSPWDRDGTPDGAGDIGHGRWNAHMAVLPIGVLETMDPGQRADAIAGFAAGAWNACAERLTSV